MYVIDDLDGVDAAYEYSGVIGVKPHGLTLRQLWRMANGRARQQRLNSLHMVCLAFNDQVDVPKFLRTGAMAETNVGKPLMLPPELEAKVQEEVERIRRENPNLPTMPVIR